MKGCFIQSSMSFAEGSTGLVSVVKGFKGSKGALKGSKEKAHEGPSVERFFIQSSMSFAAGSTGLVSVVKG